MKIEVWTHVGDCIIHNCDPRTTLDVDLGKWTDEELRWLSLNVWDSGRITVSPRVAPPTEARLLEMAREGIPHLRRLQLYAYGQTDGSSVDAMHRLERARVVYTGTDLSTYEDGWTDGLTKKVDTRIAWARVRAKAEGEP